MKKYGKTDSDLHVEKMHACREIVKEILDFGICEKQKLQIIKLMALELENRDVMNEIISIVKQDGVNTSKKLIYTE
tara:strand:+ start:410 stop:637 length:228 start_codon:yes stop_codon:yes gene_type:complete